MKKEANNYRTYCKDCNRDVCATDGRPGAILVKSIKACEDYARMHRVQSDHRVSVEWTASFDEPVVSGF